MTSTLAASARVPAPLTPLIARDGRIDAAWQALQSARLLTLTGPGGSGKTRLAMELASRAGNSAWVELASLTDPRLVAEHAAITLGVPGRSGKPDVSNIVERFASLSMVLVLDNCEHVVDAAAAFVAQLLRDCPGLKVLATSREALGVAGERIISVPPLSVPQDNTLAAARDADAIALFVERAQDVRAGFELTARNAAAVARICRRLDGIPLAIELAAARVRALDPEELAERLESSIGLLETGSRAALPRHRTIRDTIDWSYKLLSDDERRMLTRLSVFHGTFSLDAVEGVCADTGGGAGALDIVTALLDKSLLSCDPGDAGTRYRLLETVREYAAERLREAGETDTIRERHAKFFVSLAERAAPAIFGGASDEGWMARLDEEITNFRDAQDWCEQQPSRLSLALRIAVALHWYWYARGLFNEGRLRVGIALTFAENVEPVLRGRALTVLGRLAIWQGDHGNVHGPMEEAVDVLRAHGDAASLAYALHGLGIAAGLQGRVDEARRTIDEAAALADSSGRPGVPIVWVEYWRGLIAEWDRNPDAARQCYERALAAARRIGHKAAIGHSLCVLGRLAAAAGRREAAERALGESFEIFRDLGDRWGSAFALEGTARVAAVAGNAARAARLLGAAEGLREDLGIDLTPPSQAFHDATIAMVRDARDETVFWRAWAEGKTRPLEVTSASGDAGDGSAAGAAAAAAPSLPVADLRIRMLGAFEAFVGNRRIEKTDWGSNRARELLAFLACHPEGCTKSQIGLALWPDASPGQLRNTFHVTLHRLRNALALMDAIQVDNDRYRLNPSLTREFDVELFEQGVRSAMKELRRGNDSTAALTEAVARYQGDFLAGASAGEWVEERRDRLQRLYIEALDTLGRAQMKHERHAEAAEAFRLLLAADPVNEEACRRQMMCLAHLGDRGGALRAYDALARALRDELGVRPERETSALREKLSSNSAV